MQQGEAIRTYKARRRVTPGQAEALERLLPRYGVTVDAAFDVVAAFGRRAPLVLEIGSGMGEATAELAALEPHRDVLAVEVHTPGLGALVRRLEARQLTNVRVTEADGLHVLAHLQGLDEVRVFFPDPWPKARHAKRRLLSAAFVDLVAARLRPGGRLHVATDWAAYAELTLEVLAAHDGFAVTSQDRGNRPLTRFERRGHAAGRASHDVVAVRTGEA